MKTINDYIDKRLELLKGMKVYTATKEAARIARIDELLKISIALNNHQ